MDKTLDLSKTIYELSRDDPGIVPVMQEAGFAEIANPVMLRTAGRIMTIPKGALMRKISLDAVIKIFRDHGYSIINAEDGQEGGAFTT